MARRWQVLILIPFLAGLAGSACSRAGPEPGELQRHRAIWERTGPSSYAYAVELLCFCAFRGPARVTVRDGALVSIEVLEPEDGAPSLSQAELAELFPTVDGLFDLLEEAVDRDAYAIDVTYDPASGVPLELYVDYDENVADEEMGMRVTEPVTPLGP